MPGPAAPLDLTLIEDFREEGLSLDQYLGPWAIHEEHGMQLWQHVQALGPHGLREHVARRIHQQTADIPVSLMRVPVAADLQAAAGSGASAEQTIALVTISGAMTKRGSSLSTAGSTIRARREIRLAGADSKIAGVVVRFDTPGGTVAGTHDLAADIAAVNALKPVFGFAEDLCASAGILSASQCAKIFANEPGALVGSIGVMLGLYDLSGWMGQKGIKPVLIKSGPLKGTGFEGAEITSEQQAYLQQLVDSHHTQFVEAVARGRRQSLATVQGWAIGRVWPASEAVAMGLIDGIQSLEATLAQCAAAAVKQRSLTSRKGSAMSAASFQEITAACAGLKASEPEDAMFVTDQLAKGVDVAGAAKAWMETLRDRADSARQDLAKSEADKQAAQKQAPGVDPVNAGGTSVDPAGGGGDFWATVQSHVQAGLSRRDAIARTVRENPAAHQAMLAEHNRTHRRQSARA